MLLDEQDTVLVPTVKEVTQDKIYLLEKTKVGILFHRKKLLYEGCSESKFRFVIKKKTIKLKGFFIYKLKLQLLPIFP